MKPVHFILPAAAVLANLGWLYWRSAEVDDVRAESARLRAVLRDAPAVAEPAALSAALPESVDAPAEPAADGPEEFDLKKIARMIEDGRSGGRPDIQRMIRFQAALLDMSEDDLRSLIAEATALEGANVQTKLQLAGMLTAQLAESDPAAAVAILGAMGDPMRTELQRNPWWISTAFERWANAAGAAAARWLDEQAAAGYFEMKSLQETNSLKDSMEAAVVGRLTESDPGAARRRLGALNEAECGSVLRSVAGQISERPDARREWMELVREFVPADEREPVWKSVADRLVAGKSTDEVTKFLADTGPQPDERRAIAEAAVSRLMNRYTGAGIEPVTLESAGDWRQWLAETLPEGSEESLGRSLGRSHQPAADLAKLVGDLHAAEPSDAMVSAFLEASGSRGDAATLKSLAELISDPGLRAKSLETFRRPGPPPSQTP